MGPLMQFLSDNLVPVAVVVAVVTFAAVFTWQRRRAAAEVAAAEVELDLPQSADPGEEYIPGVGWRLTQPAPTADTAPQGDPLAAPDLAEQPTAGDDLPADHEAPRTGDNLPIDDDAPAPTLPPAGPVTVWENEGGALEDVARPVAPPAPAASRPMTRRELRAALNAGGLFADPAPTTDDLPHAGLDEATEATGPAEEPAQDPDPDEAPDPYHVAQFESDEPVWAPVGSPIPPRPSAFHRKARAAWDRTYGREADPDPVGEVREGPTETLEDPAQHQPGPVETAPQDDSSAPTAVDGPDADEEAPDVPLGPRDGASAWLDVPEPVQVTPWLATPDPAQATPWLEVPEPVQVTPWLVAPEPDEGSDQDALAPSGNGEPTPHDPSPWLATPDPVQVTPWLPAPAQVADLADVNEHELPAPVDPEADPEMDEPAGALLDEAADAAPELAITPAPGLPTLPGALDLDALAGPPGPVKDAARKSAAAAHKRALERERRSQALRDKQAEASRREAQKQAKKADAARAAAAKAAAKEAAEAAKKKARAERKAARPRTGVDVQLANTDALRAAAARVLEDALAHQEATQTPPEGLLPMPEPEPPATPDTTYVIGASRRRTSDIDHTAFGLPEPLPKATHTAG